MAPVSESEGGREDRTTKRKNRLKKKGTAVSYDYRTSIPIQIRADTSKGCTCQLNQFDLQEHFIDIKADIANLKMDIDFVKKSQTEILHMVTKYSTNTETFFKQMGAQTPIDLEVIF